MHCPQKEHLVDYIAMVNDARKRVVADGGELHLVDLRQVVVSLG